MEDFNTVVTELQKRLRLTFQSTEGTIYWYDGTIEYLFKLVGYLVPDAENFHREIE